MEAWDAIRSRRNVRSFDGRPIAEADLARIAEAAWRSPSSKNQQAWTFVVVTESDTLRELSTVWRYAAHVADAAAAVALVTPRTDDPDTRETYQYDLGQATMSMMVAAADVGIGSCHAAVEDEARAGRILGIPDDQRVEWLISLGYPRDRPLAPIARPSRRSLEERPARALVAPWRLQRHRGIAAPGPQPADIFPGRSRSHLSATSRSKPKTGS